MKAAGFPICGEMPGNNPISIRHEDPSGAVATGLMRELSAEEALRYRDLGDDAKSFDPAEARGPRGAFLLAILDGQPVGCGALCPVDEETAEIRQVFVTPPARRRGVGRALLAALEQCALDFSYHLIRLETGNRQPEAIALYERCGYHRVHAFGHHLGDPVSVCFEKHPA